jgi:hypothetical protein
MENDKQITSLKKLREPFPPETISKLPKPTKAQTDAVKADYKAGVRCGICGTWHHPKVVHLDYVGHAALTDRLLSVDPFWNWEPLSFDQNGLPLRDSDGGMWIKLTVCGLTRLGYGDAQGKKGPDATKEVIGDALRNAAMRFGAALDLWHKGDLPVDGEDQGEQKKEETKTGEPLNVKDTGIPRENLDVWLKWCDNGKQPGVTTEIFNAEWKRQVSPVLNGMHPEHQKEMLNKKAEILKLLEGK